MGATEMKGLGYDFTLFPLLLLLPLEKEACGEPQHWPQLLLQLVTFCHICREAGEQVNRSPCLCHVGMGWTLSSYFHTRSTSRGSLRPLP